MPAVASVAALQQLTYDDVDPGTFVWVEELFCPFIADGNVSQAPLAGQRVLTNDGTRLWRRLPGNLIASGYWPSRTDWHIDPVAGRFNGNGSAADPINSWLELASRLNGQPLGTGTQISIHGDLAETIDASDLIAPPAGVLITGEPGATTVLPGTVGVFTPEVHVAPGESPVMSSPAVPDWTALEGYRLRFLNGPAAGALSSVARADPAGVGVAWTRLPQPTLWNIAAPTTPTYPSPVAGNSFVVERLPAALGYIPPSRAGRETNSVFLRGIGFPETQTTQIAGTRVFLIGCTTGDTLIDALESFLIGCRFSSPLGLFANLAGGKHWMLGCTFHWSLFEAFSTDANHCVFEEGDFPFGGSHGRHHCGAFDSPGAAGLTLASPGCSMQLFGTYYGSGNDTYGIEVVYGGGVASYDVKPVITGTINDASIAGAGMAWAAVPFVGPNLSGIVTP